MKQSTTHGASSTEAHWPRPTGSPVLESLRPVIAGSRCVTTRVERIREHARWLAAEELPFPDFASAFTQDSDPAETMDFLMVAGCADFAFTDFATRRVFQVEYGGRLHSDAEALFACLRRALQEGTPVLDGAFLARLTPAQAAHIFRGSIAIPMLEERTEVLNQVGRVLEERYQGRFRHFIGGQRRAFDSGRGLVERLAADFPRFRDVSPYAGHEVRFYKLAQLALWTLHATLGRSGAFRLEDVDALTAFADYIVPLGLHVLGILEYAPELEQAIAQGRLIPRDDPREVELRAHTIYAVALLTEEINRLRPAELQVINAQVDGRLWTHYHQTFLPHHLTPTIMY